MVFPFRPSGPPSAPPAERSKRGERAARWLRTLGLCTLAFAGGAGAARFANATTADESPYAVLGQMARVLVLIENEYVEPVDRKRLIEGSIKGMVAELDPHSGYLPKDEYKVFQDDTEGQFGGIGVEVDLGDDEIVVIAPIEDSPAERAGIRSGDRIVAIDDVVIRGKSGGDLVRKMRGKPGSKVKLTVKRPKKSKPLYFTLKREIIKVASVKGKLLDGNIFYLRLKQFQSGTHKELLKTIGKLRSEADGRVAGVVLDLRNNPGGLVDESSAVADEFLSSGVIYSTRHRGRVVDEIRAQQGGSLRKPPLVVLVNEYSASASELVAGALQDHDRATVVGAKTFGKGSVQTILDLPGGDGLRMTTMRYYTPDGQAIQARGITPDVVVAAARKPDKSFGVIRESDLENHLPAEGPPGSAPKPKKDKSTADAGADDTHLGVARKLPDDPTGGADLALSIGYQIVRGVMNRKKKRK